MARSGRNGGGRAAGYRAVTARDIARFGTRKADAPTRDLRRGRFTLPETDALRSKEQGASRRRVAACAAILAVLAYLSLGVMGANGDDQLFTTRYQVYGPVDVTLAIYYHAYNFVGLLTHLWDPASSAWLGENVPCYWAVEHRAGVVGITLVCAVLLAVAGMLYQNVFKNPIAGPGMLGVGSGVSLGMMLIVYLFNYQAMSMIAQRYAYCYGFGAAILVFVIAAGRKLSGKGKPFDIVTMLLLGSILSQLIGFVVSYVTLFVMDPDVYEIYYAMQQMLVVDTSPISWACLGAACVVSIVPVVYLRFRMNALAFDEHEVRLMGIDLTRLRAVALICGAIMVLAAQIHCGAVGMVSLIVPFLARSWFGVEFRKQLAGCVCIGTILLLACRDIADLVPFAGEGIAIGTAVAVVAMPLFLLIMSRHVRGWE